MADAQLMAPFPMFTLDYGCQIVVEARDPATGATIPDVVIRNPVIYGNADEGSTQEIDDNGPYMFVPGPTPVGDSGTPASQYPGAH